MLSKNSQARLSELSKAWFKANRSGNKAAMNAAHAEAEQIRKSSGLQAGKDYDATSGKLTADYQQKAAKASVEQRKKYVNKDKEITPDEKIALPGTLDPSNANMPTGGSLLNQARKKGMIKPN